MNDIFFETSRPNAVRPPARKSFARICLIHKLVKSKRYPNVPNLMARMEVSARTVERDLQALRDFFHAPLDYDNHKSGFYYREAFDLPRVKLTEGEAVALLLGQQLMSRYSGASFGSVLKSALEKIADMLPETVSLEPDALENEISFDVPPLRGDEDQLAEAYHTISEAISRRETLDVIYYTASRDAVTNRLIDPYHLRHHQGAWYVIANCHMRQEVRIFALDRIRHWEHTGKSFPFAENFSLVNFLHDSFGIEIGSEPVEVTVRFDSYQARFIRERTWHSSQELVEMPDGGLMLMMTVSSLGEVKRWLLSFGAHAEVLTPDVLRQEIAMEARLLAAVYDPKN